MDEPLPDAHEDRLHVVETLTVEEVDEIYRVGGAQAVAPYPVFSLLQYD